MKTHVFAAGQWRRLGLRPSKPEEFDRMPRLTLPVGGAQTEGVIDLEPQMPPVKDQGSVGDCASNMGCELIEFLSIRLGHWLIYSVLFLYWWVRKLAGLPTEEDTGSSIADVVNALIQVGCCLNATWNYDAAGVRFTVEPPPAATEEAAHHKLLFAYYCPTVDSIDASLAQGFPVGFGMELRESFEEIDATGIYIPRGSVIGRHVMVIIGIDNTMSAGGYVGFYKVRNSWSFLFGKGGNCYVPKQLFETGVAGEAVTMRRAAA